MHFSAHNSSMYLCPMHCNKLHCIGHDLLNAKHFSGINELYLFPGNLRPINPVITHSVSCLLRVRNFKGY